MGHQPKSGAKKIPTPDYDQTKELIEKSVAMGVDPYLTLSIAQMENPFGYNLVHQHLHDQTTASVLGCSTSDAAKKTNQIKKWAYDTSEFEKLRTVINNNGAYSNRIKVTTGKSYLCVGEKGSNEKFADYAGITIRARPRNDRYCCMEIPVSLPETKDLIPTRYGQNRNTEYLSNLVFFELLKKMQSKNQLPNQSASCAKSPDKINSPEFRIQSFLGFSKNTGTGMPNELAAWRLGTNSCDVPTYGLQAMDYIVNTLMPNPLIQQMVTEAENKYGQVQKHHLCLGGEGKNHRISMDNYFKRHKSAPRFELIKSKLSSGISFLDITPTRNAQPLAQEIVDTPRISDAIEKKFGAGVLRELRDIASGNNRHSEISSNLRREINESIKYYFSEPSLYSSRKTLGDASSEDNPNINWNKFSDEEFFQIYKKIKQN